MKGDNVMATKGKTESKNPEQQEQVLGIREAARRVGKQEQYIRRLTIDGKLDAFKDTVPGSEIPRWQIYVKSLDAYFAQDNRRGARRQDGRQKAELYLTDEEMEAVQALLSKNQMTEIAGTMTRSTMTDAQKEKRREYMKKRNARIAAEKAAKKVVEKFEPAPTAEVRAAAKAGHSTNGR